MKTKEENRGKEEELPEKKELLSDEELQDVSAGRVPPYQGPRSTFCLEKCSNEENKEKCVRRCLNDAATG